MSNKMPINRDDLLCKWRLVEKQIPYVHNSIEYQHQWGELREKFYQTNGYIPISMDDSERLLAIKNKFLGERIFIIGNGPSLNKTPLHLLENEFTFITNRAYLLFDRISWRPTFYTALDWRVVPDVAHEINLISGVICFFEERFRGLLRNDTDVYWYTHTPSNNAEEKDFSYNIDKGARGAGSVIGACVQIAFYLGFREIYLIGCDLGYKVTSTVQQDGDDRFGNGVKVYLTSSEDDDPNHFDPRYFGRGKRWHDPNVKRMITGHEQCLMGVAKAGGKICNATIGGELEVYPRVDFYSLFPKIRNTTNPRKSVRELFSVVEEIKPIPKSSDSLIGRYLRCEKAHYDETEAVLDICKDKTGIMIDVGAHRGTSCIPFLANGWNVVAFEPDLINRTALITAVKNNGFDEKIKIDSRAVGNEIKSNQPYYRSEISSGISGLSAFHNTHERSDTVEVTTLREALEPDLVHKITFLKIDTEGYDLFVLKGFPWEGGKPEIIECEFEDTKTLPLGYDYKELADFLLSKEYKVYVSEWHPIVRYGVRHNWKRLARYPCELDNKQGWGNLLAFREPIDDQIIVSTIKRRLSEVTKQDNTTTQQNQKRIDIRSPVSVRIETTPLSNQVGKSKWSFSSERGKNKILWLGVLDGSYPTKNCTFVGGLKIKPNKDVALNFSLGRHGKTAYEGIPKKLNLKAEEWNEVFLTMKFSNTHNAIKFQIEDIEQGPRDSVVVSIKEFYLLETGSSTVSRVGGEIIFSKANKLYRSGDYITAFGIYMSLYLNHPLSIYLQNATMAAKKIGFHFESSLDTMVSRFS